MSCFVWSILPRGPPRLPLRRGRSRLRNNLSPNRVGLGTRRRKTTIKIANLIEQVRYSQRHKWPTLGLYTIG